MPSPRPELQGLADTLDGRAARALYYEWPIWAREAQLPPQGDWTTWLLLGGRGAGKTRAGAEWVRGLAAAGVAMVVAGVAQLLGVDLPTFEGHAAGQLLMEGLAILFLRKGIKAAA